MKRTARPYAALFTSGIAALVLQVVWTRIAVLIFGTTTVGATVVLGTFMGGLALGSLTSGHWLSRIRRPFLWYATLEGLTALLALLYAFLIRTWGAVPSTPPLFVVLLLLAPTFLMGMTLPIVVAGVTRMGEQHHRSIALAYGLNTIGGALGAITGAFWWLPAAGLFGVSCLAAVLLFGAAALAFTLREVELEVVSPVPGDKRFRLSLPEPHARRVLRLAFWGGGSSLALEIIWTRLFSLILGPSVYALGLVLFVYLLGIALGALLCPRFLKRLSPSIVICMTFLLLSLSIGWSTATFGFLPYLFVSFVELFRPSITGLHLIEVLLSIIAIAPTAMLHGLLLPSLMAHYPEQTIKGRETAWSLAANTLGAIFGTALTGLWLIPNFGFLPVLIGILMVNAVLGSILFLSIEEFGTVAARRSVAVVFVVFAALFAWNGSQYWDHAVLASGVYKYAVGSALSGKPAKIEVGEVLFYAEGISSTVAVIKTANDRVLSIDGKADASAYGDRSTQVLLAALPMSLSKRWEEVLVVGYASGVTAGVASLFSDAHVTAVEIEPAVYEAATFFQDINHGPLRPPAHQLLVDDARHFLALTEKTFDVITSEPSNPWMSGVAPLFTREFFALARRRIRPGGVMCQWLPIYGMSNELVESVLATFQDVFKNVFIFESIEGYDLLLIGSEHEFRLNPREIQRRWKSAVLQAELRSIKIQSGVDLVGRFLLGSEGVRRSVQEATINTDNNGFLEFRAPRTLHLKTADTNHSALLNNADNLASYLADGVWSEHERKNLIEILRRRGDGVLAESLQ